VKVIGITGSYGKSSTKEFLATILSAKYKVCKTSANRNSEIGVAETVLRELKPEHEIFIVEMGAYRTGEIKAICDIVHPTIGVLTAVSEQHLALFGSLEATKKAKYELIEALPENGIAIFNADNRATRELAEQTLKPKRLYSTERPADVSANAITVQPEKLSFSQVIGIVASAFGKKVLCIPVPRTFLRIIGRTSFLLSAPDQVERLICEKDYNNSLATKGLQFSPRSFREGLKKYRTARE